MDEKRHGWIAVGFRNNVSALTVMLMMITVILLLWGLAELIHVLTVVQLFVLGFGLVFVLGFGLVFVLGFGLVFVFCFVAANRLDDMQAEIMGLQRECKQIRHELNLAVIQGTLHKEEAGV